MPFKIVVLVSRIVVLVFCRDRLVAGFFFICTGRDFLFNVVDPDHFGGILV